LRCERKKIKTGRGKISIRTAGQRIGDALDKLSTRAVQFYFADCARRLKMPPAAVIGAARRRLIQKSLKNLSAHDFLS
jgi:hypothetical protein